MVSLRFNGLALSPKFAMMLTTITFYGFGTGRIASSMNSYMAKHFTARYNNRMHYFWGGGVSFIPIIMGQMMVVLIWRVGYFVIAGIVAAVGIMIFISIYKKMWIDNDVEVAKEEAVVTVVKKRFLTKKCQQVVKILTFFFLGKTDNTRVLFTVAMRIARGEHTIEAVAIFSAVYYIAMTIGRMVFCWEAKWLKEVPIEKIGIAIYSGVSRGSLGGLCLPERGVGVKPLLRRRKRVCPMKLLP